MAKKQKQGGVIDGGAVIIDDGPGLGGESKVPNALAAGFRLGSKIRLAKLKEKDFRKDTLAKAPSTLTIQAATGEKISFNVDEVVSLRVSSELEDFKCFLAANSVVVKASDTCTETQISNEWVYQVPGSGLITRIEVTLKFGSYLYEGSASLTLKHKP